MGDNPEGIVPNIGAKWFLGYNSTLGWSGRKCKMCFLNYMNRAFKWIQKHYDSNMKWLRKFSLNWAASSDDQPCTDRQTDNWSDKLLNCFFCSLELYTFYPHAGRTNKQGDWFHSVEVGVWSKEDHNGALEYSWVTF